MMLFGSPRALENNEYYLLLIIIFQRITKHQTSLLSRGP